MSTNTPVVVDYFSDVLCVWAWIAQPRLDELHQQWGQQVSVRHRYVDIFGDTTSKIPTQWGEQDGYAKFHQHIEKASAPFEHVSIHPAVWRETKPHSSMLAHTVLKATEIVAGQSKLEQLARELRQQFFGQGKNIGELDVLLEIAGQLGIAGDDLLNVMNDGRAIAALSQDLRNAQALGVKGSPTWVINEGRQLLYGNVGYRILNANIEELVKNPAEEASWC
jgi:predicted DsbA family dithiol-disulfide isomerase